MDKLPGIIVTNVIRNQTIRFYVTNEKDTIQYQHSCGTFYEQEELSIIENHFPKGGVFVDIGANVGNHALFVSKFLHPKQIIVFEPNPGALAILGVNLSLNNAMSVIDTSYLGVGLSNRTERALPQVPENNLGGARLFPSTDDTAIPLVTGDSILSGRKVDFLKIDVEGMEVKVLEGLEHCIEHFRPTIFIEVDDANLGYFLSWSETHYYKKALQHRRYTSNENYLMYPIERFPESLT